VLLTAPALPRRAASCRPGKAAGHAVVRAWANPVVCHAENSRFRSRIRNPGDSRGENAPAPQWLRFSPCGAPRGAARARRRTLARASCPPLARCFLRFAILAARRKQRRLQGTGCPSLAGGVIAMVLEVLAY